MTGRRVLDATNIHQQSLIDLKNFQSPDFPKPREIADALRIEANVRLREFRSFRFRTGEITRPPVINGHTLRRSAHK